MVLFLIFIYSQLLELKTTVDKYEITLGERIKYVVEFKTGDSIKVEPEQIGQIGNFEVIEQKEEITKNSVKFIYIITTFKVGEDTIPVLSFSCIDRDANQWTVDTDPIIINVRSVLPPEIDDIKDIRGPVSLPRDWVPIVISIFIICIVVALLCWLFIYRKRRIVGILAQRATKSPQGIAYERLASLKFVEGKFKEYYTELSDIIRRYIEARYNISAPTETTYELYKELRSAKVEYDKIELIKDFLLDCDFVKFAKYAPFLESIEKDRNRAKDIIDKTITRVV